MADIKAHAAHGHEPHGHDAHDAHHHDDGAVHAHISSVKFYVAILAGLMVLTLLTVGLASIHLGKLNLVVAIVIASLKATLVVLFFMHLKYDNKWNATMFVCGLLFIGIFFAYTMNDTGHRAEVDEAQGSQILPSSGVFAPGGMGDAGSTFSPERSHENVNVPTSVDPVEPHHLAPHEQVPGAATGVPMEGHGSPDHPADEHK
jgi:cytochrome c oxidase subunit 4